MAVSVNCREGTLCSNVCALYGIHSQIACSPFIGISQCYKEGSSYFANDRNDEGNMGDDVNEDEEGHGLPRDWDAKGSNMSAPSVFISPPVQDLSIVTD